MGVIIGPIIGPVAGGYLSEAYSWRWVFFMIVPFTLMALMAVVAFIRDTSTRTTVRFDWTGFLALSVAVTCLQITLDSGQRADWFDSYKIIILTCLAVGALYIFVAHVTTTERPFLRPALLKDRNFVIGVTLMFIFGLLNFTPITLLPTLLQNLRGYPDSVIGYVLAIRGLGTLAGFFFMIVGSRIDPRWMVVAGFATQGISGWYMAQADLNVMLEDLFWPMIVQGFGVGLLWPSITAITFSTLNRDYVDEGTAIYHLIRNMASSIYISISVAVIMRTSSQRYAEMTDHVSPFNQNLDLPWASRGWSATTTEGLSHLGSEIGRQAAMIGYINSFYMFSITAFAFIPLVLLIRWKKENGHPTVKEGDENVHD
jgi:DHA2 family multidrug resistance protein